MTDPVYRLSPNPQRRLYRGGGQLRDFRAGWPPGEDAPEDWVGSTVATFGQRHDGLSVLADGRSLRDAVVAEPVAFLGEEHLRRFGTDVGVLVKLLDAGERLPVHVHPDRAFAREHLNSAHGKTEAWFVLGTRGTNPSVYLGFAEPVGTQRLTRWVLDQDIAALVAALNPIPVRAGDVVLVPAGTPHSLGPGVFVVEIQEPTDFSIRLERRDEGDRHPLGLATHIAMRAVNRRALVGAELAALQRRRPTRGTVLPPGARPFFRVTMLTSSCAGLLEPGFSVLVGTAGRGAVRARNGRSWSIRRGECLLTTAAAGELTLTGDDLEVVRCRPAAVT